jgi:acetoin utilization deacetylase AcuC-like enzyme
MPLHAWSSARYAIPLPEGHRFPIAKYALLRDRAITDGLLSSETLHEPERASPEALTLVHDAPYVEAVRNGTLDAAAQRLVGFPWSPALWERSVRSVGGTIEASRAALTHGVAMNLAGGTHHAFASHGEGFCVFNDVAVAFRLLRSEGRVARAAVVDLDVHQGNGTHAIFADDPSVFTFSMHGGRNYPFRKVPGTLDVELEDGTGDTVYLELLRAHLPQVLERSRPDLVFFLAGADPHEGDSLGRLKLTFDGLKARDFLVLEACRAIGVPVVITIAGGYGRDIDDTVRVHLNTVGIAATFV